MKLTEKELTEQEYNKLWNSYLYPNTTILINNYNIKDKEKLREVEATHTFAKLLELRKIPLDDIDIGKDRLNSIHKYLFQGLYPFAGEYRKVNMKKDKGTFLTIKEPKDIDDNLNLLFKEIDEMQRYCYNKIEFANILARLYTALIFIHPYREGNGKTVREFLREYTIKKSEEIGIGQMELDWSKIEKEELDEFIEVVHLYPYSIASMLMNALVEKKPKRKV